MESKSKSLEHLTQSWRLEYKFCVPPRIQCHSLALLCFLRKVSRNLYEDQATRQEPGIQLCCLVSLSPSKDQQHLACSVIFLSMMNYHLWQWFQNSYSWLRKKGPLNTWHLPSLIQCYRSFIKPEGFVSCLTRWTNKDVWFTNRLCSCHTDVQFTNTVSNRKHVMWYLASFTVHGKALISHTSCYKIDWTAFFFWHC
jgi:hypothetical protein